MFSRVANLYAYLSSFVKTSEPVNTNIQEELSESSSSSEDIFIQLNNEKISTSDNEESSIDTNILFGDHNENMDSEKTEAINAEDLARQAQWEQERMEAYLAKYKTQENLAENNIYSLLSQVFIGMTRDVVWGMLTYHNSNFFPKKMHPLWGTTLTQMLYTLPTTAASIKVIGSFTKMQLYQDNRRSWVKQACVYAFASWSSIPTWNMAQLVGTKCGEVLGMNSTSAGYFSGVFTGVTETAWQNGLVIPLLLKQSPEFIELALNSLGGAVWQWIYQANLDAANQTFIPSNTTHFNSNDVKAGFQIAAGVAMSTILMTTVARTYKKFQAIQKSNAETNVTTGYSADNETDFEMSASESSEINRTGKYKFYGSNQDLLFQDSGDTNNHVADLDKRSEMRMEI